MKKHEDEKYIALTPQWRPDTPEDELHTNVAPIFTSGARCAPRKFTDPETGKTKWHWVVISFEDDSFMEGEYVNPAEIADSREELIKEY